ncbi:unnamed protein product [Boreogadus saida]
MEQNIYCRYRHVDMEQNIYCRYRHVDMEQNTYCRNHQTTCCSWRPRKLGLLPDGISIKESVFENPVLWTLVENIASFSTKAGLVHLLPHRLG